MPETTVDTPTSLTGHPRPLAVNAAEAALAAARAVLDKKAERVVVYNVRGKCSYADYLVVCTAASERQSHAVGDAADDALRNNGQRPLGTEGEAGSQWLLIDGGDVIVHVFSPEGRDFYELDRLWADAPRLPIPPAPAPAV